MKWADLPKKRRDRVITAMRFNLRRWDAMFESDEAYPGEADEHVQEYRLAIAALRARPKRKKER